MEAQVASPAQLPEPGVRFPSLFTFRQAPATALHCGLAPMEVLSTPFPCACRLQSGEWMSQFGLSRVSEEWGKPRGSDLLGLGCVWCPQATRHSPAPKHLPLL